MVTTMRNKDQRVKDESHLNVVLEDKDPKRHTISNIIQWMKVQGKGGLNVRYQIYQAI